MRSAKHRIDPLNEEEWAGEVASRLARQWTKGVGPSTLRTTLARHPALFARWDALGEQLLTGELPGRDRELLILRTAFLTRGIFQWAYHEPLARKAGMSDEDLDRIVRGPGDGAWPPHQAALVSAVDELTWSATISDATWSALADRYNERQLIEIVVVVGQYVHNAFLANALRIEPPADLPRPPKGPSSCRPRADFTAY